MKTSVGTIFLALAIFLPSKAVYSQIQHISEALLSDATIQLQDWKGISGDDFRWLESDYDYSDWADVSTILNSEDLEMLNWDGIGWFKTKIKMDSTLIGEPVPFLFPDHNGASELFLDQEFISGIGSISLSEENFVGQIDPNARFIVLNDTLEHTLTVRYSNYFAEHFIKHGKFAGFSLAIIDYDLYLQESKDYETERTKFLFILGLLATLSVLHLLLVIFYPAGQQNFYFFIFVAGIVFFTFSTKAHYFSSSPIFALNLSKYTYFAWFTMVLGQLRFVYSFQKNSRPVQLIVFLLVAALVAVSGAFNFLHVHPYQGIITSLVYLEFTRVLVFQKFRNKNHLDVLLWGVVICGGIVIFSLDSLSGFLQTEFPLLQNQLAISVLAFSISVYLLREFAKAQIKLEYKYLEVKHLSERSIDQERRNKEKELRQKLLEAENARKTAELEEARAFQLSMLPSNIPETTHWDIAVYMETSQEVGGDYYDFHLTEQNELTVALGDATGHGMKAGIMVATAKSYFHSLVGEKNGVDIIKKMSLGIRNMDLKFLYMGLMLLKCREHSIKFTSAGMPPALLYRKASNSIEEVVLKAMPLGTKVDFPYQELQYDLKEGDIFLLFSDGLMELFNNKREQLGLENIGNAFLGLTELSASGILQGIRDLQNEWSGDNPQEDDVTVLVLKAKFLVNK